MMKRLALGIMIWFAALAGAARAEVRLIMFEQAGCAYCARWHRDVGDAYHLTREGLIAPLWRLDIHEPLPNYVTLTSKPVFTPTFVLIDDQNAEIARLEGYPGEDFFWGLLGQMLHQLPQAETDTP